MRSLVSRSALHSRIATCCVLRELCFGGGRRKILGVLAKGHFEERSAVDGKSVVAGDKQLVLSTLLTLATCEKS